MRSLQLRLHMQGRMSFAMYDGKIYSLEKITSVDYNPVKQFDVSENLREDSLVNHIYYFANSNTEVGCSTPIGQDQEKSGLIRRWEKDEIVKKDII